jgi:O-antigen ligase
VFLKALLIALVVYVPNQLHFPSDLGLKGLNVFNVLLLIALVAVMAHKREGSVPTPLRGRILLYYLVMTIAFFVGISRQPDFFLEDVTHFKTVITYSLLYFIGYHGVDDKSTIRTLMTVILGVVFLMSVEVLREAIAYGLDSGKRAAGAFGDTQAAANYAGVFFAIFLPVALSVAVFYRERLVQLAAAGTYALGVIAVFYTFSRTALAAVAVTTVLIAVVRNKAFGIVALVLLVNYALWAPDVVQQRIESTTEVTETGEEKLEGSAESRFYLWEGGWEMIKDSPYGIGLHNFHREIEPHLPPWIIARDAHNHFVLITTEAGVQGGVVFVLLLFGFYLLGFRLWRRAGGDPEARVLGIGYVMAVTGLILGNLYNSLFYSGEVMGNFWLMTGLVARYVVLLETEAENERESAASPAPSEPQAHGA